MEAARTLVETVFLRILNVSWQASVLVVFIVAAQWLLRKRLSAGWRYTLWGLLLARLLLLWTPSAPFSMFNLSDNVVETVWDTSGLEMFSPDDAIPSSATSSVPVPSASDRRTPLSLSQIGAAVWLLGLSILLGAALVQQRRIQRRLVEAQPITDKNILDLLEECRQRMGVRRTVTLSATRYVQSPALLGFFRPRLLLPAGLAVSTTRDHLRYVFLHELAHLKRGDILMGWLSYALAAVHWFNPLLWWARRRWSADRELACDTRALLALESDERLAYGHALLDEYQRAERLAWNPGWAGVLDGTTNIEKRLRLIVEASSTLRKGSVASFLVLFALAATALTGAQDGATKDSPFEAAVKGQRYENTIGLYSSSRIAKGYRKMREGYARVKARMEELQKGIDTLSKDVQEKKNEYEKVKATLPPEERNKREQEIRTSYEHYSRELRDNQDRVDEMEAAMLKTTAPQIARAIAKVGEELGCTLVDTGNEETWRKFFRKHKNTPPVVDITPLVIDELNKDDQANVNTGS